MAFNDSRHGDGDPSPGSRHGDGDHHSFERPELRDDDGNAQQQTLRSAMARSGSRHGNGARDSFERPELRNAHQQAPEHDPDHVPDMVKSFVVQLYRCIRENNVYQVLQMYEISFQELSEFMFKQSPWPTVEAIAPYVDNDHVFCLLYRELWFRHVHAHLTPSLMQRAESWDNYCTLFWIFLHRPLRMQLPNEWLWDMIDEFIYQFQSHCRYRAKLKAKTDQELKLLCQYGEVWNIVGVLNILQAFVQTSNIRQILEDDKNGNANFTAQNGYDFQAGGSNVLKVLGYFSIIGLLRVHCLLGDYYSGLQSLMPIGIHERGLFCTVESCRISAIYYYVFANLMLQRYVEAIKSCNQILVILQIQTTKTDEVKTKSTSSILVSNPCLHTMPDHRDKTGYYTNLGYQDKRKHEQKRQDHQVSHQLQQTLQRKDQLYALLAICLHFCPRDELVDKNVKSQLKEKLGEKIRRMEAKDEAVFQELFSFACPKFITPSSPNYDEVLNYNQDAYRLQLKLFLSKVNQQQLFRSIREYLKSYHAISISKLAFFLDLNEPTMRMALLAYKYKTRVFGRDGRLISHADVDFFIDLDVVNIVKSKATNFIGDYLIEEILKSNELIGRLDSTEPW